MEVFPIPCTPEHNNRVSYFWNLTVNWQFRFHNELEHKKRRVIRPVGIKYSALKTHIVTGLFRNIVLTFTFC